MPLTIRMGRRSGAYELTKDLHVVDIDVACGSSSLQWTLGSESTAYAAIEYIAQRLDVDQVHLQSHFGLRVKTKNDEWRWIELESKIWKQVERYSCDSVIHLSILFYAPSVLVIADDTVRYYYYLAMRAEVLSGRLPVDSEKAIALASYSLQADHGDYMDSIHTTEKLESMSLLPTHMTTSKRVMADLITQVQSAYDQLAGMPANHAYTQYIQMLVYTEQYSDTVVGSACKDSEGSPCRLAYNLGGISSTCGNTPPTNHDWLSMTKIVAHKRNLMLKFDSKTVAQFSMDNVETTRYTAWLLNMQLQYVTMVQRKMNMIMSHIPHNLIKPSTSSLASPVGYSTKSLNDKHAVQPDVIASMTSSEMYLSQHDVVDSVSSKITDSVPYRPAPDYMTALTKPTINPISHKTTLSEQNVTNTKGLHQIYITNGSTQALAPTSQPNLAVAHHSIAINQLPPKEIEPELKDTRARTHSIPDVTHVTVTPDDSEIKIQHGAEKSNDDLVSSLQLRLRDDNLLRSEFDSIPRKRVGASVAPSLNAIHTHRNRFNNVLPYEETRFVLPFTKHNPEGYINANNITVRLSPSISLSYIATQAPTRNTSEEFWAMVWLSGAKIIAMLTKVRESTDGKQPLELSHEYWPQSVGHTICTGTNNKGFSITNKSVTRHHTHIVTTIILKNQTTNTSRQIYHTQYILWPNGSLPSSTADILAYRDEIHSLVRQLGEENLTESASALTKNKRGDSGRRRLSSSSSKTDTTISLTLAQPSVPVIVHCCSGAGRTGVYLMLDILVTMMQNNVKIDVAHNLRQLRRQRMHLVQNVEQYKFIYQCLIDYINNSRLI